MANDTTTAYVATAFYSQYNLIMLGGSALFSLASASPVPAAMGVAAELVWLGLGPRLPAFRRSVDDQVDRDRRALLDDEVTQGMQGLTLEHTSRLLAVGQSVAWISMRAEDIAATGPERAALLELETIRPAFLRLCLLHERLQHRLEELRLSPPAQEVVQLSQAYAAEKDLGLRFTLHQAIKLAQKRGEQQHRLIDVAHQVELKLALVEQALSRLREQQQLGLSGADLVREIQGVMTHVLLVPALEAELEA